jgi:hypothetical protein
LVNGVKGGDRSVLDGAPGSSRKHASDSRTF